MIAFGLIADIGLCSGKEAQLFKIIGLILKIFKVAIPILLIIFASIDFSKAVFSQSDGGLKKAAKAAAIRTVAAVFIFFVPTVINVVFVNFLGQEKSSCLSCVLDTTTCNVSGSSSSLGSMANNSNNNNFCANFTNEEDCNRNSNECEWRPVSEFNLALPGDGNNYCVNTYFIR